MDGAPAFILSSSRAILYFRWEALPFVLVNLEPMLTYTLEGSPCVFINSIKLPFLAIQIPQKGLFVSFYLA